jgi:hypothetical protein
LLDRARVVPCREAFRERVDEIPSYAPVDVFLLPRKIKSTRLPADPYLVDPLRRAVE